MTLADEFAGNAETAGFIVHRGEPPRIEGAGVSRAVYALADTGSVVLAASPDEPRSASLLPDTHITLVQEAVILRGLEELFAAFGDNLPSSVAIVTGPSRSADIEQLLTVGVHGPGEVHVVIQGPTSQLRDVGVIDSS
jgi:L-lactate utilization protein LutC